MNQDTGEGGNGKDHRPRDMEMMHDGYGYNEHKSKATSNIQ